MLSRSGLEIFGKWLHGNKKYDYTDVFYPEGNIEDIPVKIICPEHGPFFLTQVQHIYEGLGCPVCDDEPVDWREHLKLVGKTQIDYVDEFENEQTVAWKPIIVLPGQDGLSGPF